MSEYSLKACVHSERATPIKCVFLGCSGVGKTSLIDRFIYDYFFCNTESTIGVAYTTKHFTVNNHKIKLDIWDTAGQEKYNSIMPLYYRGAGIIIIVFELGNYNSFNKAKKWVNEIKDYDYYEKNQLILLLGNKYDKNEQINLQEYINYADNDDITFYHCSAKSGLNVNIAVMNILEKYINKKLYESINKPSDSDDFVINLTKRKSYCCY